MVITAVKIRNEQLVAVVRMSNGAETGNIRASLSTRFIRVDAVN